MAQTRIDQFYKVTTKNKEQLNITNKITKFTNKSQTICKKRRNTLLKPCCAYENDKSNRHKVNKNQQILQDNSSTNTNMSDLTTKDDVGDISKNIENNTMSPSNKKISSFESQQQKDSKYVPKTSSPIKIALERSQKCSPQRKLFKNEMDELIDQTVDNLNAIKEGSITDNVINLEKVYSSRVFNYKYSSIDTTVSTKFEVNDVIVPTDTYSQHFFLVIVTVFSNPINCGYFDKDEAELIFTLLTLSKDAQALLIRMLKRKHTWHKVDNIKYNEISDDLRPIFEELVSQFIFTSNIERENITALLNLLQVHEIRKLCQELKICNNGTKQCYIQSILKFCNTTRSLFPGIASPATKVHSAINKILGYCVLLNSRVKQIFDKIIMLFIPNRDPEETVADMFFMLLQVQTNKIMFPVTSIKHFPIFASKVQLLNYVEAKNALFHILGAIEKKDWQVVRNLGSLASQYLSNLLETETQSLKNSTLPRHIRHFMPCYIWLKVLSKSIDAFKKTEETMLQAIEFLNSLINQNCHMRNKKGQWYNELIKIEMFHRKNFDNSVTLISKAVLCENLTTVDKLDLLDRTERLIKRKSGISENTKNNLKITLDNTLNKTQLISDTNSITIEGELCRNITQRKSTWRIINDSYKEVYGSVEDLALYYYKFKGYPNGIHCEGALPITLFGILFWDEIYTIEVPGAFVSLYQEAPMDLYSSEFYENRKQQIDMKLEIIRKLDSETLSKYLESEFTVHYKYKSICHNDVFNDSSSFQEIVNCLGVSGVIGICEQLIHNFPLWKAGFPDLIVWNPCTKEYKIVEVKGPGDSLSTKQKLWLEHLKQLGLNTEICYCTQQGKKRKL